MEKAYEEQSINLGFGYGDKDKWLSGYLWWERIRFHELSEFDEAKRSCRRRLAGHNERRRKNPPESQEGPSRKGSSPQVKGNHCRQADEKGRLQTTLPGNGPYKHFQIR